MEIVSFSSNVKCLSAKYIDHQNIDVKNSSTRIEQAFTLHNSELLNSVNDVKIGGYSALYLTNLKRGEDILEYKQIITNSEDTILTNFISKSTEEDFYLYINTPKLIDAETKTTCKFVAKSLVDNINNTYFELELIDSRYCRVYHRVNNDVLYLTVNNSFDIFFKNLRTTAPIGLSAIDEFVFSYILDKENDKLSLYKPISGYNYNVVLNELKQLTLSKITSASYLPFNAANTFQIQYNDRVSNIDPKFNTSWVSYKNINDLEINPRKSAFKNKNNYLISTQYSYATGKDLEINILPLKNQLTKSGISQRGDYLLNIPNKLYPQTSLRDYEKIHIGNKQETGVDEISLTYSFYSTEFVFKPDEYTVFKTPDSLYPYRQININDTLFAVNGSLGGDSPHSSDKIFTEYIKTSGPNNGMYLCTWLSGGNENNPGIWLDRYFNTSKISPIEALTATSLKLYDYTSPIEEQIENNTIINDVFFDVRSNLTFEPSREYIYQRLGNNYIKSFITHLDNYVIFDALTSRTLRGNIDIPTKNTDRYLFENKYHYSFIEKSVSSFTFSFWLEADWSKPFGYQLAGNFNNKGFGIFNDEIVTPFIFVPYLNSIYVYNTDFVQINQINLGGQVKHIIRINPLDDIYVIVGKFPNTIPSSIDSAKSNIIFKLKSNGTVFDADIAAEIPSYINIFNTETDIYFLLDELGNVAKYNILREEITTFKITIPAEFGVVFDIKSLGIDKFNNIVGFRGEKSVRLNSDEHVFLMRNSILVKENNTHDTRTILMSSTSLIYDFAVDAEENIYVLHNKFISKYNSQRDLIYKVSLGNNTNIAVDLVKEYTNSGLSQYPVILSINSDKEIIFNKLRETDGRVTSIPVDDIKGDFYNVCNLDTIFNYYNLTNYSLFLKNNQQSKNILRFRIEIPNKYYNRDNLQNSIDYSLSDLSIGKHHFVYRLDTVTGNISLFVDGKRVENITFDPAEYALENVLYNTFNVGAGTYFNGTIINNYIKQNDRYFCQNIIFEQPRLYGVAVDDIDIKFLNLNNLYIGEFTASLPCGERNQIEQIQRLFKWQIPGNKSNNINIRVKSNILSNETNAVLREIIKRDIQSSLPASVNINNITFEKY